jgi:hypothetical protein
VRVPAELLRETYICKRDLLEYKIRKLNEKLETIAALYKNAAESLEKMLEILRYHVAYLEYSELKEAISYLERAFREAVEGMIYYEIPYDSDTEKFEKAFNVKLYCELLQKTLGVILVEESDRTLHPVIICTDYSRVSYYEGKRDE